MRAASSTTYKLETLFFIFMKKWHNDSAGFVPWDNKNIGEAIK